MYQFQYKGVTEKGVEKSGIITATSKYEAIKKLSEDNLIVTNIKELKKKKIFKLKSNKKKLLLIFTEHLFSLLKSNIELSKALTLIHEFIEDDDFKKVIYSVINEIKGGKTLSEALKEFPEYFNEIYVNLIKAGEESGNLIKIIEELYNYQSEIYETKKFVVSTLIYPALLFVTSIMSALILIVFVIPKFGKVFEDLQQKPPFIMKVLLFLGVFIKQYFFSILIVLVLIIIGFIYFNRKYHFTDELGKYLIKIPLVGNILTQFDYYRFFNTLSILMEGGVPIINSLVLCEKVVFLENIKDAIKNFYRKLKQGKRLSSLMRESGVFPVDIVSIVSIGEETGLLPEALKNIANNANKSVKDSLKKYLSILEPLTIIIMGIFIGGIILSMLSAIFSINSTV